MKLKKLTALVLALVLLTCVFTSVLIANADDVHWSYDADTYTLTISGSGDMQDYAAADSAPWSGYIGVIQTVIVEEGVTSLGDYSFTGAVSLGQVRLADSVTSIGANCFASCPLLLSLTLSGSIRQIADASFAYEGTQLKSGFTASVMPGSYALSFVYDNNIPFVCENVRTGVLHVSIQPGQKVYFPYSPAISGTYRFYSVSKHDPLGYIYDGSKAQISYNDDHATSYSGEQGSTDFGLTKTLTAGAQYYLAVKVFNPSIAAEFDVYFEPVQYTVSGTLYAMNSPAGDVSNIVLDNATMDGVATDHGTFTVTVSGLSKTVTFACDGVTLEYTFSVDDGDTLQIPMMMCDVNADGIVNARDYARMLKSNSRYLPLFINFMNYRC